MQRLDPYRVGANLTFRGGKGINMRVLLIEDDSATAQSIELMLKSESFNVYTTDSAKKVSISETLRLRYHSARPEPARHVRLRGAAYSSPVQGEDADPDPFRHGRH